MNNRTMHPASPGMPLHCHICPKKPDFSDVSHLLTHIGSKGHLSHHFRLTITANSDPSSKRLVDQYNEWFKQWNVEELMSERLDQKERKKSGVANRGRTSRRTSRVPSVPSSRTTPVPTTINWAGRRSQQYRESTLDPQLGRTIKQEPKSRSGTPVSGYSMEAAAFHRSYMPPMQSWPIGPYAMTPIQHERSVLDSMYSTPTSDSGDTDIAARPGRGGNKRKASGSSGSLALDDDDAAEADHESNENVKLKGVIWPGMDLFDSATPDMRRKRNQKKTHSVLQMLQATSEAVEPVELVFDADGVLRRERPVTGNPEEDYGLGPLPGEAYPSPQELPLPKKKPGRQPRKALAEKNVNSGRILRNQGSSKRLPFAGSRRDSSYLDDQEEDDELTYGGIRPRKQRRMAVHRDVSGPEATLHHPAPFSTLTSGFNNGLQAAFTNAQVAHQHDTMQRAHSRQPSLPYAQAMPLSQHNPFNLDAPDFGGYSQMNGAAMFPNHALLGSGMFPMSAGPRNGIAFPTFTMNPQPLVSDADFFQNHAWTEIQAPNAWDSIGNFSQADTGVLDPVDSSFSIGVGDFTSSLSTNPLFIGSAHAVAEDDDATVSPPSERS